MREFEIYKALGDPIRLEIIRRLTFAGPPINLSELTKDLGVSRQGARKQVQVLVNLGAVKLHSSTREVLVELRIDSLTKARDYLTKLESQWDLRLSKLKDFLEKE